LDESAVLGRLVARYSPSRAEAPAVAEFISLGRALGYRTRVDGAGNGIAVRGRGHPEVLFLGHIDTVEGERPVRRAGGWVHGRGVVDAKGALAAALLAGQGFAGPGTFRVVAAVGEETDSRGARHLVRGHRPDAVIVGEPSGWQGVTIGYKGELRLEASFAGRRTHYASPFPTATDRAVDWVDRVRSVAASRTGESPFRSLSVKAIGIESPPGTDPEQARVTLDVRIPPGLTSREVEALLPSDAGRPSIRVLARFEPVEVPRSDPVVRALAAGVRAHGGVPTLWRKSGTSDLNLAIPAWTVPGAAYGPGDARLDHTDRERLSLAELRRSVDVLRTALRELVAPSGGLFTPRR
jgi:[amino group carrier protein]-lysine/ornithine hydrolase